MLTISLREARRLALCRAGLLKPAWAGFPQRGRGGGPAARRAALKIVERFGYLQLDTVSIAGARSHAIVLLSRLPGLEPALGEELLRPGEPLFEYWGHEASWLPMQLYPLFAFRRRAFRRHPWWGDLLGEHAALAEGLLRRIEAEGPLRSADMEGRGSRGWWDLKLTKKLATALWSSGQLAIRERRSFQRAYDLPERVIPERWREQGVPEEQALERLLILALRGHGWASTGTLAQTWRLRGMAQPVRQALARLQERGEVVGCALEDERRSAGWIRPADLELAARLARVRPRGDRGVLLSPFDPLLWDRARVQRLFGFEQVLEIFKPAAQRKYGYFCLPVLAGERLVGRCDLKADKKHGRLRVLSQRMEPGTGARARGAVRWGLERFAAAQGLGLEA